MAPLTTAVSAVGLTAATIGLSWQGVQAAGWPTGAARAGLRKAVQAGENYMAGSVVMERLGEAVERACRQTDPAFRRVNLEILGNTDTFLHAHLWRPLGPPSTNCQAPRSKA